MPMVMNCSEFCSDCNAISLPTLLISSAILWESSFPAASLPLICSSHEDAAAAFWLFASFSGL